MLLLSLPLKDIQYVCMLRLNAMFSDVSINTGLETFYIFNTNSDRMVSTQKTDF